MEVRAKNWSKDRRTIKQTVLREKKSYKISFLMSLLFNEEPFKKESNIEDLFFLIEIVRNIHSWNFYSVCKYQREGLLISLERRD